MHEPLEETKVLNAGLVSLMSINGTDLTPAEAARTSYRTFVEDFTEKSNDNLIDYLVRKDHAGPLGFAGATFYMVLPIFVARQLIRHTVGVNINEESLRYIEPRKEFWIPSIEECNSPSSDNKQGSSDLLIEDPETARQLIIEAGLSSHGAYGQLIELGLSRELARTVLPVGQYTAWYWQGNLRTIFHLLKLRMADPSGNNYPQEQAQIYANAMLAQLESRFPNCFAAWRNHIYEAVTFSGDEIRILREFLDNKAKDPYSNIEQVESYKQLRGSRKSEFLKKIGS